MITLYGISNCDTIKKARNWLQAENIYFKFHDYRKDGISQDMLEQFESQLGWESLLNKRGTTFRQLSDEQKQGLNRERAIALMLAHPAMIKRPVLVKHDTCHLGFKPDQYQAIFS
ncbi:ArsC family reductase [Aestuariibacter salexigens]|uniref:ArsC family reductase n=1 Tax=Aestuariibacter salexigens TaxID=226010 RepID=UPI00041B7828|nr:ArsC family reductase [Aestuariibacter salexigens]